MTNSITSVSKQKNSKHTKGYLSFIKFMSMMPCSTLQFCEATGKAPPRVYSELLPQMLRLGLIKKGELIHSGRQRTQMYELSDGTPDYTSKPRRYQQGAMDLAFLWRAIQEPITRTDICNETGLTERVARKILKLLRDEKLAHIAGWEQAWTNTPSPLYCAGNKPNKAYKKKKQLLGKDQERHKTGKLANIILGIGNGKENRQSNQLNQTDAKAANNDSISACESMRLVAQECLRVAIRA